MADDNAPQFPDMGALLGMAMEMQTQLQHAQSQAVQTVFEAQAGGGAVRIEVTGGMEFRSVTISPDAVDPDDVEMLQDLILAALRDAVEQVAEMNAEANPMAAMGLGGGMSGGLGGLGGLDLGGIDIGGMFGGGGDGTDDDVLDGAVGFDIGAVQHARALSEAAEASEPAEGDDDGRTRRGDRPGDGAGTPPAQA